MEAAFKYVTINLIASSIFLTALGLLYGVAGTLNMADLARIWPTIRTPGIDMVLAVLFVIAFSIKAGLFPLFFWLPASYHTPPAAIGAVFAGLLTKVGVYALMRIFTLLFQGAPPALFTLLLVMSAATMVIGLVAAQNERDFRRILSFNLVGHIGYTTASLSLLTPAALAGAIFYVLHHIVVITNLFLVSGVLLRLRRTTDMTRLGGLYRSQPLFSALAMVPIFSLAGVPPLSGFLGKLAILEGTFAAGAYWVGGIVLVVGLLTLLSMGRTWADGILETGGERERHGHAGHAAADRDLGSEPRDAGDHVRRRTALRAHVTRGAAVAAARRVHTGGAGRYAVTCCSEASFSRLPGRRCRARSRSANLLVGYVFGYVILALLAKGGVMPSTLTSRTAHAVGLAGFFVWELVLANVRVAIDVLRPRTTIRPAVVAIPLDVTSDGEILLLSMLINITPGSVTIDLSDDRRTLYVHVMHMTSAEASRREIKEGFERRVKLLFE